MVQNNITKLFEDNQSDLELATEQVIVVFMMKRARNTFKNEKEIQEERGKEINKLYSNYSIRYIKMLPVAPLGLGHRINDKSRILDKAGARAKGVAASSPPPKARSKKSRVPPVDLV